MSSLNETNWFPLCFRLYKLHRWIFLIIVWTMNTQWIAIFQLVLQVSIGQLQSANTFRLWSRFLILICTLKFILNKCDILVSDNFCWFGFLNFERNLHSRHFYGFSYSVQLLFLNLDKILLVRVLVNKIQLHTGS